MLVNVPGLIILLRKVLAEQISPFPVVAFNPVFKLYVLNSKRGISNKGMRSSVTPIILSKLAVFLKSFTSVLNFAIRMILGLSHTHLRAAWGAWRNYCSKCWSAADLGLEFSECLKNSETLYMSFRTGIKRLQRWTWIGRKQELNLPTKLGAALPKFSRVAIRAYKFMYAVVKKSPVYLITDAASCGCSEVLRDYMLIQLNISWVWGLSQSHLVVISHLHTAEKQYLTSTVKICSDPSVWLGRTLIWIKNKDRK